MELVEPERTEFIHHVPRAQLSREDGALGGVLLEDMNLLEVPQHQDQEMGGFLARSACPNQRA